MVSLYPMSSGRLGPPRRAPSWRRRRKPASPPGPESRSTALPMTARSSASRAGVVSGRAASGPGAPGPGAPGSPPVPASAAPVQFDAEPDQVLQRARVQVAGDDRGHGGVAGDARGRGAVQPGAAVPAGPGGLGAVRRPLRPDLGGPLLLQGGAAVEPEQVGQGDVGPDLDRLPGALGEQIRRDQAAHAFIEKMHRDWRHISFARVLRTQALRTSGCCRAAPSPPTAAGSAELALRHCRTARPPKGAGMRAPPPIQAAPPDHIGPRRRRGIHPDLVRSQWWGYLGRARSWPGCRRGGRALSWLTVMNRGRSRGVDLRVLGSFRADCAPMPAVGCREQARPCR